MTRRGFKPRRRRLALAALLGAAILTIVMATVAWAVGELSQKPGKAGCVSLTGTEGACQQAVGLDGAFDVAVSPDGRNVYAVGGGSNAVTIFDRDPATGALTQKQFGRGCIARTASPGCVAGRALFTPIGIAVSADGKSVYVASNTSSAVAIFNRDLEGDLTQKQGEAGCVSLTGAEGCQPGRAILGPRDIAVSPDGNSVYVASNSFAVAVFARDSIGTLTQLPGEAGCISQGGTDGCKPGRALFSPAALAVSLDARSVYVVFGSGVANLDRDPASGELSQQGGLDGCLSKFSVNEGCREADAIINPDDAAVSPDGENVYVVDGSNSLVATLDRDAASGALSPREGPAGCLLDVGAGDPTGHGCQAGKGLEGAEGIAVSPDGRSVYVASRVSDAVAILDRDPSGGLTQKPGTSGCVWEKEAQGACQNGTALDRAQAVAASPDGRNVYVAAFAAGAIAIFDRATPPPPPPPSDTTAPAVSGFKLAPPRFKAAPKGRSQFRFTLSEPAAARIGVERARPGRRVGKRCKAPAPKLAKRRPCTRFTNLSALSFANRTAGANAIAFDGRVGRRKLPPGRYRATILATDAAGNRSALHRASFTVLAVGG